MILTRYIGKDLLLSTVAISFVLLLVIVSGRFVGYMADAAAGDIPADLLMYLLVYTMPSIVQLVLPLGFFLATMLVFGQLYVDSEIIVMQACGMSQARLLRIAMLPALIIAVLVAYCSLVVAPAGEASLRKEMEKPSAAAGFSTLVAGKFQYLGNGVTVYVQALNEDKTQMQDVFLIQDQLNEEVQQQIIARAELGTIEFKFDDIRYLVLSNGHQFQLNQASLERSRMAFEKFSIKLPDSASRDLKPASVDVTPTLALLGSTQADEIAALQWRASMPLMVIVMAIAGFSLSRTTHRKGRYGKLLPGVLMFFIYFTLLSVVRDGMEDGKMSLSLGMWWVHGLMALVAALLFAGEHTRTVLSRLINVRHAGA